MESVLVIVTNNRLVKFKNIPWAKMLAVKSEGNPLKHKMAVTATLPATSCVATVSCSDRHNPRVVIWWLPRWSFRISLIFSFNASIPTIMIGMFFRSWRVTPFFILLPFAFLMVQVLSSCVIRPSGPSKKSITYMLMQIHETDSWWLSAEKTHGTPNLTPVQSRRILFFK